MTKFVAVRSDDAQPGPGVNVGDGAPGCRVQEPIPAAGFQGVAGHPEDDPALFDAGSMRTLSVRGWNSGSTGVSACATRCPDRVLLPLPRGSESTAVLMLGCNAAARNDR